MSKKPIGKSTLLNPSTDSLEPSFGITATIGGKRPLVGEIISLNCRRESFFGAGKIWLNSITYHAAIPSDISDKDLGMIQTALERGVLVKGKQYISPIEQDKKVLDEFASFLKLGNKPNEMPKLCKKLRDTIFARGAGGYTAHEIIRHVIKVEAGGKNRPEWVQFLQKAILMCEGVDVSVPEPDHETQGLR